MAIWDVFKTKRATPVPPPSGTGRAMAGGRISTDNLFGTSSLLRYVLPPEDAESNWRLADLDSHTLDRLPPYRLLELLADLSPDVSRALWDLLRELNPGWEVTARRPGSDDQDARAQAALDAHMATLKSLYGSVDVVINRLFLGALVRGGFFGELVLDARGRVPVDLATPDPASVRFERRSDPVRGDIWQVGQWQAQHGFVALDRPTVRYIPIDPMPGKPYGRAPLAPALFVTMFLLGLLHDLRRVVAQQGYPRLDVEVDLEKLTAAAPPSITSDPQAYKAWVEEIIAEVKTVYAGLEPDDAYVHTSVVKVNRPVGAVDADALEGIDGLIEALERMSVRALKTMPFLMAISESATETQANRQFEAHLQGIRGFQHLCESLLEHLLTVGLQAQGITAVVEWRFAELRASEAMRDAQVDQLRIQNAINKYLYGWTSHKQASQEGADQDPDVPAPRKIPNDVTDPTAAPAGGPGTDGQELDTTQGSGVGDDEDRARRNGYHAGPLPVGVR